MIKVRIETEEGKLIEQPIDLSTLEKWIEDGILTADTEVWSDTLTGRIWKKVGDLTLFKRTALEKQGAGSLAMEDLTSRNKLSFTANSVEMSKGGIMDNKLGTAKALGGVGLILSLVGDLIVYLGGLPGSVIGAIVSITGFILFVIAMKYISDALDDKSIFNNTLVYIIASILAVVIPLLLGFGSIFAIAQRGFSSLSDLGSAFGSLLFVLILIWIGLIVAIAYLKKALDATAQGLNVNLFKVGGILYLVGIITIVILVGAVLLFVGEIILMVAFFSIPERVPLVETATPSVRPETRYCANCGSRLSSDDRFCPNCGTQA